MKHVTSGLLLSAALACGQAATQGPAGSDTALAGPDSCDDPDAHIACCFLNMPAALTETIADRQEPGDKLVLSGSLFRADGVTPAPGVIMYAYHTDTKGYYSKRGTESGAQKWHGRLHGWCRTDELGRYAIRTIRPARYPDNSMPAHIHAAVKTENGLMYWISDFVFRDDSLVSEKYLRSTEKLAGGTGVVDLKQGPNGTWTGTRNIILAQ
jgi:protocatechuate 3,4-dioxygenase, beta subunit